MSNNPSAWLLGSLTIAIAALTFFGVEGDGLARLLRVSPCLLGLGAGLLLVPLVAGFATLSDPSAGGRPGKGTTVLRWIGIVGFVGGFGVLLYAYADATSEQERPTVTAEVDREGEQVSITVHAKAAGLAPDEYLFVIVQGANERRRLDPDRARFGGERAVPEREYGLQRIYKGRLGPNLTGEVDASLRVPLTDGLYDQVWAKTRILESEALASESAAQEFDPEADPGSLDAELELEFGGDGFPCSPETQTTGCAVVLVPARRAR